MYLTVVRTTAFCMILNKHSENAVQNLVSIILFNFLRFSLPILVKHTFCYISWWDIVAFNKNIKKKQKKTVNVKKILLFHTSLTFFAINAIKEKPCVYLFSS